MPANPITDGYAQTIRDQHASNINDGQLTDAGTRELDESVTAIAEALHEQLPEFAAATVGGIMLHAVGAINELYTQGRNRGGSPLEAYNGAVNLVALAATRLYSPEPVGDLPPVDGGEPT